MAHLANCHRNLGFAVLAAIVSVMRIRLFDAMER